MTNGPVQPKARCITGIVLFLLNVTALCAAKMEKIATFDPSAVNNNSLSETVAPDSQGSAVLRVQILLDRANFSSGQIDGHYGKNMGGALKAFQKVRGIPESGNVDLATWQALNADSGAALQQYTIAAEDVAGPFQKMPKKMADKAKLEAASYESAIEGFGEKFHCAPSLLTILNPGKHFDKQGETILVPNVATATLPTAASVVVNGSDNSVSVVDTAGKVVARFPASVGSKYDPLPVGAWKILGTKRDPVFHYNPRLFWDADSNDKKSTIPAGPNNPVGAVWISLSKPHYGIHGTPEPSQIGYTQSHGCIRLTNWDALKLAAAVKPNTPATLEK